MITACTTIVGATVFIFSHFVSQTSFNDSKKNQERLEAQISKRLDRIENKLDVLMLTGNNSSTDPNNIFKKRQSKLAKLH